MAVYFVYFYNDPILNELTLHAGTPGSKRRKVDSFSMDEKAESHLNRLWDKGTGLVPVCMD